MITQIYKKTIISDDILIYFFDFISKMIENQTYNKENFF